MSKFKVKIVEKLQKIVEVEAETYEDAEQKVRCQYRNCDIVLDSGDYVSTVFALDGVIYDD